MDPLTEKHSESFIYLYIKLQSNVANYHAMSSASYCSGITVKVDIYFGTNQKDLFKKILESNLVALTLTKLDSTYSFMSKLEGVIL